MAFNYPGNHFLKTSENDLSNAVYHISDRSTHLVMDIVFQNPTVRSEQLQHVLGNVMVWR